MHLEYHWNWKEVYVVNFSVLFEKLNAVYLSAFNTATISKSLGLPFRRSDFKTGQFQTNVILRAKDLVHYLFETCNSDGNVSW